MSHPDPLHTTELLALLEEACAPVRHDVRNRLASVRNLAFFVRRKLSAEAQVERDPRVNAFLLKIEDEVQRTDQIIDAWSAKLQGVRESGRHAFSVLECVRLAIDSTRQPTSVSISLTAPTEAPHVAGDLHALAFAVRCLIENAAEAMGAGVVLVQVEQVDGQCQISVVDRGPGIADQARSLERFGTTKPGHIGLGLCMAQRIALRHGGELTISSPELGAEVSLRLPLARTPNADRGGRAAMKAILLVEDDESNRVTLSALLEDDGFVVDVASSFAEASRKLSDSPPPYVAILLDHSLGDGYGSDLIPLIRRVLPKAKVVAMSGNMAPNPRRHAVDAELPKGLHFPEFIRRLRALLSASG